MRRLSLRWAVVMTLSVGALARADLFSPGPLSKPHAEFEGISNCTKCHPAGGQLSQETCLSPCHAELKPRVAANKGLHGLLQGEKRNCETCHRDHQGREFALVDWGSGGKKGFDHKRTGWLLKGGHQKVECEKCHEKRLIVTPVAQKLLTTRPKTLLGVTAECEGCHFDEHRGQEKDDCSYCHNEVEWKKAPGFDHANTNYPLKGKHVKVACEKCHPKVHDDPRPNAFPVPRAETFLKLDNIDHAACTDCHKDPHEGRFGGRCQSCHVVEGWLIVRNAGAEREFHQKTRYPLKGAHLDVDCKTCHGPFPGQPARFKNMQFDQCTDCHPDGHQGQLAQAPASGKGPPKQPDCTGCHTVDGFTPARYGLKEHANTRFPLEGAHRVTACDACHEATPTLKAKVPAAVLTDLRRRSRRELFSMALFDFSKPLDACQSCHADVHKGQFDKKQCTTCHQADSFANLTFNHDKDSRYPLTGKHAKVECRKCHFVPAGAKKDDKVNGQGVVRYTQLDQTCAACHEDVHAGQFSAAPGIAADCEKCHTTDDFKKTRFKHQPPFTTYLLDGQHAKVACEKCHPVSPLPFKTKDGKDLKLARYKPLERTCEACHADFHKGAFQGFEP